MANKTINSNFMNDKITFNHHYMSSKRPKKASKRRSKQKQADGKLLSKLFKEESRKLDQVLDSYDAMFRENSNMVSPTPSKWIRISLEVWFCIKYQFLYLFDVN